MSMLLEAMTLIGSVLVCVGLFVAALTAAITHFTEDIDDHHPWMNDGEMTDDITD